MSFFLPILINAVVAFQINSYECACRVPCVLKITGKVKLCSFPIHTSILIINSYFVGLVRSDFASVECEKAFGVLIRLLNWDISRVEKSRLIIFPNLPPRFERGNRSLKQRRKKFFLGPGKHPLTEKFTLACNFGCLKAKRRSTRLKLDSVWKKSRNGAWECCRVWKKGRIFREKVTHYLESFTEGLFRKKFASKFYLH